ncbi:MAG: MCE family protein, partial [Chloroflexi bacterium]|nr:MCE family protein [Chloroflexota bacterium]
VAVVGLAAGCTLQTAGAPKGDLALHATFDDAQHLVVGHAVKVADVTVGTVTGIELDGYRARVTLSIVDGRRIPVGTSAVLAQTSLLGENYVRLQFPDGFDPEQGPFLSRGDEIVTTSIEPELEHVAERAIEVVGAIQTGDVSQILDAASEGLGGRGAQLDQIVDQLARLGEVFAGQQGDLAAIVDGLGRVGVELGAGAEDIGRFVDTLAGASDTLATQRERLVTTVAQLTELARVLNDVVLEPHGERLGILLTQLDPIAATLASSRQTIEDLVSHLEILATRVPLAVDRNHAILLYAWAAGIITLDGEVIPFPFEGSRGAQAVVALLSPPGAEK